MDTRLRTLAEGASQLAVDKLGCKLHLFQDPREAAPQSEPAAEDPELLAGLNFRVPSAVLS